MSNATELKPISSRFRPEVRAIFEKGRAQRAEKAELEMTKRIETMMWQHIDIARQIASHSKVNQKDAREEFFKEDHRESLECQKWPKWTSVWQLSLLQMNQMVQQSEGKTQRLRREAYNRELIERLAGYDWWYDVIAPDQNGDRRRWHVRTCVLFFWEKPEKLLEVLQQYINKSKPDLGLTDCLFFLAPPSREERERREKQKKAEEARLIELARKRTEEEQKRKKKEREDRAAKRMQSVLAGETKSEAKKADEQETISAEVDELASMLDPFAEFDMSTILKKGGEND